MAVESEVKADGRCRAVFVRSFAPPPLSQYRFRTSTNGFPKIRRLRTCTS